jgi:hypothetical protein
MASGQVVLARRLGALDYATSFSACTYVQVGEAARTPLDLKGSAYPSRLQPEPDRTVSGSRQNWFGGRVAVPPPLRDPRQDARRHSMRARPKCPQESCRNADTAMPRAFGAHSKRRRPLRLLIFIAHCAFGGPIRLPSQPLISTGASRPTAARTNGATASATVITEPPSKKGTVARAE